jgi:hypothetical protein
MIPLHNLEHVTSISCCRVLTCSTGVSVVIKTDEVASMAKVKRLSLAAILLMIATFALNITFRHNESPWNLSTVFISQNVQAAPCDGDLNVDGLIDTSDLPLMVSAILTNNATGLCADLNEDTLVNSLDLQFLTNLILNPSPGNAYYIAQDGNDSDDGSLQHPWRTVSNAWRKSGGGDTVMVREGTYTEGEIWLTPSRQGKGEVGQMWTLRSYPGEQARFTNARFIVDASFVRIQGLVLDGVGSNSNIDVGDSGVPERVEILDNLFTGRQSERVVSLTCIDGLIQGNIVNITSGSVSHAFYIKHGSNNIIRDNHITGMNKYGIQIYDEDKYSQYAAAIKNLLVENNTIVGSQTRSGIVVSGGDGTRPPIEVDGVVIRNNLILNHAENAILVAYEGRIRNISIYNNVLYGNDIGIEISADDVDGVMIKNNIFLSNRYTQTDITSRINNLVISHNLYHQPASVGSGAHDDNPIWGDPMFVNAPGGDFHLQPNSPAIDAGVDLGLPFNGVAPDLGAFETE